MFTRMMMIGTTLLLASCSFGELNALGPANTVIYPNRRIVVDELHRDYDWGVALPSAGNGAFLIPRSFDDAISLLDDNLDPLVMTRLSEAFAQACSAYGSCQLGAPEFWDAFDEQIGQTLIDVDDTLGEYVPRLSEKLAESWCLFDGCIGEKTLATAFPECVSPQFAAELIIRGAIVRASGLEVSLAELVAGLGDSGRC